MRAEITIDPEIDGKVDAWISDLAGRQHGVVARAQLTAGGVGAGAVQHRIDCGRLHVLHRGVYAVGHVVLSREAHWTAAVLASGAGAVLSHRSAAALWGMRRTTGSRIEVTVPRRRHRRPGIHARVAQLAGDEVTVVGGIPVTGAPRTLLDLAAVLPRHALRRAVDEAEVLRLADSLSLGDLVDRHPGRRGVATLRRIVEAGGLGAAITRSELEERFLAFLDDAALPRPNVNSIVEGIEVDLVWPDARLVVELDGFGVHGTRSAFERDRVRDRRLQAAGWRVVRVTWRHLHGDATALRAELRALTAPRSRLAGS